jgi:hypothetical protein
MIHLFLSVLTGSIFIFQLAFVKTQTPWTGLALFALATLIVCFLQDKKAGRPFWNGRILFLLCLFIFLSNFRWHGSDDLPASLMPFNIIQKGDPHLDNFAGWFAHNQDNVIRVHGHLVSFYPVLSPLLSLPVYLIPALRGVVPDGHVLHQLEKISASLMCAVVVWLFFRIFRKKVSEKWAFILALVFAMGTSAWSLSSQALWQHPASTLMLTAELFAIDQVTENAALWYAVGFFAVCSVAARSANAVSALFFGFTALLIGGSALLRFIVGAAAPATILWTYWYKVVGTGLPAEFSYQSTHFHLYPRWNAISGLIASPGRGILFFSPVMIWCVAGAWIAIRDRRLHCRAVTITLALNVMSMFLLIASYGPWNGGFSFGPRYLTGPCVLGFYFLPAVVPLLESKSGWRRLWWLTVGWSVAVNAIGAYATWSWENIALLDSVWNFKAFPPVYLIWSLFH